ncbi:caspase domain-containing protein [Armillaria nabsnona]|nr:caspase domain-containing protein [Armillaria nabsnona]
MVSQDKRHKQPQAETHLFRAKPLSQMMSTPVNNLPAIQAAICPQSWEPPRRDKSLGNHQTFALVIGIDEYKFVEPKQDLQGAIRDADEFNRYLLNDRGVPEVNIINLRNGQATRLAIIEAFIELKNNLRITPGEVAIIIYFAGHGAVAHKPSTWKNWETPTGEVKMLCPADINHDLNRKDKAKGNNITLILDCCHATGMNRDLGLWARNLTDVQDLSPTCDEHIYSQESLTRSVQESVSYFGLHILLAACRRTQIAWEDGNNGIFTTTLLRSLRNVASSDLQPTYNSLMNGLPPMRARRHTGMENMSIDSYLTAGESPQAAL